MWCAEKQGDQPGGCSRNAGKQEDSTLYWVRGHRGTGHRRTGGPVWGRTDTTYWGTPRGPNPANQDHTASLPWEIPESDANWIKPVYNLSGAFLVVLGTHSQVHD